jgi:transcriptional regulator with XRE-family HTH domain
MQLKDRLAELRRARGLSLRELRERIEARTGEQMAISYLSALERVGRAPSIDSLSKIAAGYDMSLSELLAPTELVTDVPLFELPPGLEAVKKRWGLSDRDVMELTTIQFRGRRPESEREWESLLALLGMHEEKNL